MQMAGYHWYHPSRTICHQPQADYLGPFPCTRANKKHTAHRQTADALATQAPTQEKPTTTQL